MNNRIYDDTGNLKYGDQYNGFISPPVLNVRTVGVHLAAGSPMFIRQLRNTPDQFNFQHLEMSSTHAEARFIKDYWSPDTIFVVSPYKNRYRYSRPCSNCVKFMRICGVINVVYSTGDSGIPFIIEDVHTMPLIEKSRGDR